MPKPFIQLTQKDCKYLLDLIKDMDSTTVYTQKQRSYTVPKLQKISQDPSSARLIYQDVEYLLDLVEDDDFESEQREITRDTLVEIQNLQKNYFERVCDIEQQRESRRLLRAQGKTK